VSWWRVARPSRGVPHRAVPEATQVDAWLASLGDLQRFNEFASSCAEGNEESVGRALHASGVPRDEVFITTKFNPAREDAEAEAQRSLERLGRSAT
jgi:hypothetical protein